MTRRVTVVERDSLIAAYLACRSWRREAAAIVGEHAGWRIWMSEEGGFATSEALGVTVELTPPVLQAWMSRVRERFLRLN